MGGIREAQMTSRECRLKRHLMFFRGVICRGDTWLECFDRDLLENGTSRSGMMLPRRPFCPLEGHSGVSTLLFCRRGTTAMILPIIR